MYKLIDGVPSLTQTMKKTSYVMQYDNRTRNAAWVFEILNEKTLDKKKKEAEEVAERSTKFFQDRMIHEYYRASKEVYRGNYERGHLAAAANHKWSQKATDDTFLLSNIAPQKADLNKNDWKKLEKKCRNYTKTCRNVYVYSGPLYCPTERNVSKITYRIVGDKAVPSHFFKVIILEKNDGTLDVECYTVANADNQPYKTRKLYEIERMSGLVFSEKSPSVSNEEERVTVRWKAEEKTSEMNSVDTTFTITRSQDSKEQVF
ncbi:endonuclease G, mitochondrial-like [Triplophysa rosa]|nr:endonuclease G, mitochondrial-like [Triplophysa rosa]